MVAPKFFLISSSLTEEQIAQVRQALEITPLEMILVANPADVPLAQKLSDQVSGLHRPIGIVGNFVHPISAVMEDGEQLSVTLESNG